MNILYIGIDWSSVKHDVCYVNSLGASLLSQTIPHSVEGFEKIEQMRQKLEVPPEHCVVGMETTYNLLIDFLWDRGYKQIYVVPPIQVKQARPRLHASGAYNDQSDALLIAQLLRDSHAQLLPWFPDSLLIRQMRSCASLIEMLTTQIVSYSNRMTSVLKRYYPAALQVFSALDIPVTQAFLQAYPTPQVAAQLSLEEFIAFCRQHRNNQPKRLQASYARLQQPQPEALPATVIACSSEMLVLSKILQELIRAKQNLLKQLNELFLQHPDQAIFASLPGAGEWLAPALLAKLGDDRRRFPQAEYLQGMAGTCPVTKQSGKRRVVVFRHACDHELRQLVHLWSRSSLRQSAWAEEYYREAYRRCGSQSQALRMLGNRWIKILWKLWQTNQVYDEGYHLKELALRRKPLSNK